MGYQPKTDYRPTRESFNLSLARGAYLRGEIDIEQFEREVSSILRGGTCQVGRPIGSPRR